MIIRKARKKDIDGIYRVLLDMMHAEDIASRKLGKHFMDVRKRTKNFMAIAKKELLKSIRKRKSLYLVAEVNEKIVGYAYGSVDQYKTVFFKLPKLGALNALVVLKQYRGEGIAKALNNVMEAWFKEHKVKQVALEVFTTNPAVSLYHKWGYKIVHHRMVKKL